MKVYKDKSFALYFGDARTALSRKIFIEGSSSDLFHCKEVELIRNLINLSCLYTLKQEHGDQGVVITEENAQLLQEQLVGDFLITTVPYQGLAIYTADCLPIVIYDPLNHSIGICHAGWRGSLKGIASVMLQRMAHEYGTSSAAVRVFFGPSARRCCYAVSPEFQEAFKIVSSTDCFFEQRGEQLFFDLVACNQWQLEKSGVTKEAFCYDYNECTIENDAFCSSRRDSKKGSDARQLTIVSLQ